MRKRRVKRLRDRIRVRPPAPRRLQRMQQRSGAGHGVADMARRRLSRALGVALPQSGKDALVLGETALPPKWRIGQQQDDDIQLGSDPLKRICHKAVPGRLRDAHMKPGVELSELDVVIGGSSIVKHLTERRKVFRAALAGGPRCDLRLEFQPPVQSLLDCLAVLTGSRLELPGCAVVARGADDEGSASAAALTDDKSF